METPRENSFASIYEQQFTEMFNEDDVTLRRVQSSNRVSSSVTSRSKVLTTAKLIRNNSNMMLQVRIPSTNSIAESSNNWNLNDNNSSITTDCFSERDLEDKNYTKRKNDKFKKHLTDVLCLTYGLFVITLGLVIYISDVIMHDNSVANGFNLYLAVIALIFILFATIHVRLYFNHKNRQDRLFPKKVPPEVDIEQSADGQFNIKLPKTLRPLKHSYCFSKDGHSENFYLKLGAAGFCIGHLVHSGLLVGYQLLFLTSDRKEFEKCANVTGLLLDFVYPIYSFLLLHFIFKYSNIVINRYVTFYRFGLIHCIASSLCFWMWTIMRETIEALSGHPTEEDDEDDDKITESYFIFRKKYSQENDSAYEFVGNCANDAGMRAIYRYYSPYLYPFTVEYSILVVGVLFVIWQSIGKCKEKEETSGGGQCDNANNNDNLESNVVIHADCHSANKGLFSGIVILVLTVVGVILFLVVYNDTRYQEEALLINLTTGALISVLMTISTLIAYRQITKLDVTNHHISPLDDMLLFICIPAFFLNTIVTILPAIRENYPDNTFYSIIDVLQVLIQTAFIVDGLRRCSNSKELRREKPGRELITFLIVCNVSVWIMQTFEVKSHDLHNENTQYYGAEFWTILGHLCIPLMMFYRFHSSVCLVDIWKSAYEPEN